MSTIPADLRYAKSHEWLKLESDGTATIGITDFAQDSLGDITYVQMPKVGGNSAHQGRSGTELRGQNASI